MCAAVAFAGASWAEAPANYYRDCENKSGKTLLESLHNAIRNPEVVGYKGLWTLYMTSDVDENGKIWDMYSTKRWTPGAEQCGNYTSVGDCYNREHSMPKSWFNDALPMYADAFHIYPTDGKVNGQRSNYPYGECEGGTTLGTNAGVQALGRLGKSTFPGYAGTVFEPVDDYKGDFARSYFYMAACYYDRISSWDSEMLGGTNFPAFTGWALDLLLKWHAQDPVSDKERNRNDVVYANQGNRNPFIDYPSLVDHIWGTSDSEPWHSGDTPAPEINRPSAAEAIDLGYAAAGAPVTIDIALLTSNAVETVNISATAPFAVAPASVPAETANAGTILKLSFAPAAPGSYTGELTVSTGRTTGVYTLKGTAVDGIPFRPATNITAESFVLNWLYVGMDLDGKYNISIRDAQGTLPGYPASVDAKAGSYTVNGLEPATEYTCTIEGDGIAGTTTITTASTLPFIDFLFDGDLFFRAQSGIPSAPAEIILATENIDSDITLSVNAPFELSADSEEWVTTLTMSPDENRFFLRLYASEAGEYETSLSATDGSCVFAATVRGKVTEGVFLEDFEAVPDNDNGYVDIYNGTACQWLVPQGGFWKSDPVCEGERSLRFSKKSEGFVAMNSDRAEGIGTVSFMAAKWNNSSDAEAIVLVETSTDGGTTWHEAGRVTVSEPQFSRFSVAANVEGNARMRLRQISGARWLVDNIGITDAATGVASPGADRHQWNAFCTGGSLIVDTRADMDAAIYCTDGRTIFAGTLTEGRHTFDACPGQIYIVAAGGFSRTVLIR